MFTFGKKWQNLHFADGEVGYERKWLAQGHTARNGRAWAGAPAWSPGNWPGSQFPPIITTGGVTCLVEAVSFELLKTWVILGTQAGSPAWLDLGSPAQGARVQSQTLSSLNYLLSDTRSSQRHSGAQEAGSCPTGQSLFGRFSKLPPGLGGLRI